jgi:Flp pilus assembly protein CpaB
MRRGRIFFYLAFIVLLGMVAALLIWQRYFRTASPGQQAAQPTAVVDVVNVLVVTQRVPRGGVIEGNVLGMVPLQRNMFIEGMFTNVQEVEGKLSKFDLDPGIPLTRGMLASTAEELSGTGSNAALSIPRGMVAVSVPIGRLSLVSYPPQQGDHVNVIVALKFVDIDTDYQSLLPNMAATILAPGVVTEAGTNYLTSQVTAGGYAGAPMVGKTEIIPGLGQSVYSVPSEAQRPRMVSQNLLQDAVVLKVGNFSTLIQGGENKAAVPTQEPAAAAGQPGATPAAPPVPDFISLIVTPQDAITLNYLIYSGAQVTLVLRAADDDSRIKTEAVTLQFLLDQYNIPVPVKLPYSLEPRSDTVSAPGVQVNPAPTPAP